MKNFKRTCILSAVLILCLAEGYAHAGNFGIGAHTGYGVIKYEESTSSVGNIDSSSSLDSVIFGVSGEYSFIRPKNFFAAVVTDWAFGLEDVEKWKENSVQKQKNDISIFAQFYDLRFGYKNSIEGFYYRGYLSGGWDGFHFRRKNFVVDGKAQPTDVITEDFSLWRMGGGLGLGYKFDKWAVDSRAAYAYYFDGEVRNSAHSGLVFDTNGTCLDAGIGIIREIAPHINLYVGGSYTRIDLDEGKTSNEIIRNGNEIVRQITVFPDSKTQIMTGIVNVTYAF